MLRFFFGKDAEKAYRSADSLEGKVSLFYASDSSEMEKKLLDYLHKGDLVLFKGSRGMALEQFIDPIKESYSGWGGRMLKELFLPLINKITFFNIFQYITFRASYAAVTALFISLFLGPKLILWLKKEKLGQEIREDGPESHQVKSGTPTMGGILIIFSIVVSVFLWQDIRNLFTWVSLFSVIGFGLIGFFDDYLKVYKKNSAGLQAKFKFIAQILLSTVIVTFIYVNRTDTSTLLYIPFFKFPVLDLSYLLYPLSVYCFL